MNESLVKYLAGLLDADGCLCFGFSKRKNDTYDLTLRLTLTAASRIDHNNFLEELATHMGTVRYGVNNGGHAYKEWRTAKRADLEMLLPRLIKHMVIKAKHWQWLLETWRELRSTGSLSEDLCVTLKEQSKKSRAENAGPVKPKNHPTWAWVAGYLDGDGWYSNREYTNKHTGYKRQMIQTGAVSHINDICALEFLQKAFGGFICAHSKKCQHVVRWQRNLGKADASFALKFLPKVVKHSRLKKHKIEMIIHYHRQRLSVPSATA